MDARDLPSSTSLEQRLEHLERQNRRLRAGAVLLTLGLIALATSAFRSAPGAQSRTLTARSLVLVDASGTPKASIRWDHGRLRLDMPADHQVRLAEHARPEHGTPGAPSDTLKGVPQAVLVPHRLGPGAELVLGEGGSGPSLILADGSGHVVARMGGPVAQPVGH